MKHAPTWMVALVVGSAPTACSDAPPVRLAVGADPEDAGQHPDRGDAKDEAGEPGPKDPPAEEGDEVLHPEDCQPGHYVGTYTCQAPIPGGALYFDLIPGEQAGGEEGCLELCEDLVVDPTAGKLKGEFVITEFEGQLRGGLNCATGQFHAEITDGTYGLHGVVSGVGLFRATVDGERSRDMDGRPRMAGSWYADADETGMPCDGTFEVRLEPTR